MVDRSIKLTTKRMFFTKDANGAGSVETYEKTYRKCSESSEYSNYTEIEAKNVQLTFRNHGLDRRP
jgi:hypothetical protein